ncbi:MAG TPA: polyphosphate kinase 1 [Acidimicrobiaceae bacterium]|nr:polyphosphate kinase 1 [Acidimicrobiaceae bacterium]HCH80146.1 polyphosphate kinase 1 [Acidimicrobiaceae bacterium]
MVAQVGGWDHNDTNVFNRELSWLAFNARVLQLSSDTEVPLLEQIRFLAIFSSNLDEFFQVRVSGLRDQQAAGISTPASDGRLPAEQLALVRDIVTDLVAEQERVLVHEIMPALREQGIELSAWHELDDDDQAELSERFRDRIFPVLTPLAVDPGHPFPYVSDLSLNLAVVVRDPRDERELFARVKVPNTLPRWLRIGDTDRFVPLEEVIAAHLDQLFPGMEVQEHHAFRVTRNADLSDALDEADDLLSAVEYELRRRRFGRATRLEVDASMTDEVLDLLLGEFDLDPSAVYVARTPLDPTSFNEIADIERPALRWPEWKGVVDPRLQPGDEPVDIFAEIRAGDVLVQHPYESFSRSVVEFIHQAANDPDVLAIKITLYRTASSSPIVDACIKAAEQGKQVAVLVELKARFDEAANIGWARRLEQAGVHVAYGLLGLKIHTKIAMAVREEPDGIRRYCHIGTGNYNHRTARIYEDIGILTADPEIGADVADLFNHLTGYGREIRYSKLLVAPDQLRPGLEALIDNEIASGRGRMILKMNSLVDVRMTEKLYEASQAGVDIDLIIRGQCSLKPGIPGLSDRIRVRSIIGRYLEHSRVYHFANGNGPGEPATYIGSADLMSRNLNRRVEALVRLDDPRTQQRVHEILDVVLDDDRLAWTLAGDGVWTKRRGPAAIDTHARLQQLARGRANG